MTKLYNSQVISKLLIDGETWVHMSESQGRSDKMHCLSGHAVAVDFCKNCVLKKVNLQ